MTQLELCHDFGVSRLILANELVGRAEIEGLPRLWAQAPEREYYVLVDSIAGAQAISDGFARCAGAPSARVLIEVGMRNGRCGVRTLPEGLALDLLGFAISHPCTTFDKWSLLMEVADDYTVLGGLKTFF